VRVNKTKCGWHNGCYSPIKLLVVWVILGSNPVDSQFFSNVVLKPNFGFNIVFKPYNIWKLYTYIVTTPKTMRIRQKSRLHHAKATLAEFEVPCGTMWLGHVVGSQWSTSSATYLPCVDLWCFHATCFGST